MKLSFLWPDRVRKISVASYMWFFDMILFVSGNEDSDEVQVKVKRASRLPARDSRCNTGRCKEKDKEYQTHLFTLYPTNGAFKRNASHCPESRNRRVRKAWAIISGRTN